MGVGASREGKTGALPYSLAAMARRYDTVSFLTDYGWEDEFVGVVKSVIRDLAPHVTVIDLSHGVRPVRRARRVLGAGASHPVRHRGGRARRRRSGRRDGTASHRRRGGRRWRSARRSGQRLAGAGRCDHRWRRAGRRADQPAVPARGAGCHVRRARRVRAGGRPSVQRRGSRPSSARRSTRAC